jgi:nicotinamidase-related amidase
MTKERAMRMMREKSQLLIIDVQEKLLPAVVNASQVEAMCARLLRIARRLDAPVTVSQQYPRGLGPTVAAVRAEAGDEAVVLDKTYFSCFADEGLRNRLLALREEGRTQIVLAGIEAHICVAQTALDLAANGFETFVAADAISARSDESRSLAMIRMRDAGARIVDSEMVMFEWLERAGTPEFKDLQQLIK